MCVNTGGSQASYWTYDCVCVCVCVCEILLLITSPSCFLFICIILFIYLFVMLVFSSDVRMAAVFTISDDESEEEHQGGPLRDPNMNPPTGPPGKDPLKGPVQVRVQVQVQVQHRSIQLLSRVHQKSGWSTVVDNTTLSYLLSTISMLV